MPDPGHSLTHSLTLLLTYIRTHARNTRAVKGLVTVHKRLEMTDDAAPGEQCIPPQEEEEEETEAEDGDEPVTDRDYIKAAISASCLQVEVAFDSLSARDFDGDPNSGITEQTLKCMLVAVLRVTYPDIRVSSERVVDGGRLDLLLVRGGHVEVLELKYIRTGFLSFVRYSENPRVFYANIKAGLRKVREHANPLNMQYRTTGSSRQRRRSGRDDVEAAREQATRYVKGLVLGDIDPLPKATDWSVGYHVICGVGPRVLVACDRLVFLHTRNPRNKHTPKNRNSTPPK